MPAIAGRPTSSEETEKDRTEAGVVTHHEQQKVVIVGAGGNIGSHLVEHVARIPSVGRVVLIDPDHYTADNLTSQRITPWEVGRLKAVVQTERISRVRPELSVSAFCEPVESVPWGELEADVILSCPDSLAARLHVNEVAWRLGVCWVDAGVRGDQWMVRVSAFRPQTETACLECSLQAKDYGSAAERESCFDYGAPPPSRSPASLGALAASLQALECQRILTEDASPLWGRQLLIEAAFHHHYVSTFRLNPSCRLDHQVWDLQPLELRLGEDSREDLSDKLGLPAKSNPIVRVAGQHLITGLVCSGCGQEQALETLEFRIGKEARVCADCGGVRAAPIPYRRRGLCGPPGEGSCRKSLAALGVRHQDVLVVEADGQVQHYQIVDACRVPAPPAEKRRTQGAGHA
jgi:molybdopterin/thiamine biosynthesis adenylyltransferase